MNSKLKTTLYIVLPLAFAASGGVTYLAARKPATAPASTIRVEITPERVARGKYIFENLADCAGCHSPRDMAKYTAPPIEGRIGAGFEFPRELGMPGRVVAPNLTPDPETGLGKWTDGEKLRAIREGVSRDGRALFPLMPYQNFAHMSDEDAYSLVAYLNSLPAIRNPLPRTELEFPLPWLIKSAPQPVRGRVASPEPSDKVKYGQYLVGLAGCQSCHTKMEKDEPVQGMEFAGGETFQVGPFLARSANITPDEETGIGLWSKERFISKFRGFYNFTHQNLPAANQSNFTLMPWLGLSRLTDDDLEAIYTFLRTVRPVYNPVDKHPAQSPS